MYRQRWRRTLKTIYAPNALRKRSRMTTCEPMQFRSCFIEPPCFLFSKMKSIRLLISFLKLAMSCGAQL